MGHHCEIATSRLHSVTRAALRHHQNTHPLNPIIASTLPARAAEFESAKMYSPILSGVRLLNLNSTHSVSLVRLQSSCARVTTYSRRPIHRHVSVSQATAPRLSAGLGSILLGVSSSVDGMVCSIPSGSSAAASRTSSLPVTTSAIRSVRYS